MTTTTPGPPAVRGAVGVAHTRVEGRDKVTGAARYAGEIPFADLAHGWLVLSTVTRGRILDVETAPVLDMPGVLTVLHHGNAPRLNTDYIGLLGTPPDPTCAVFQNDGVPFMRLAGRAGRRRDPRGGPGGRRGARGDVRPGAPRHRARR